MANQSFGLVPKWFIILILAIVASIGCLSSTDQPEDISATPELISTPTAIPSTTDSNITTPVSTPNSTKFCETKFIRNASNKILTQEPITVMGPDYGFSGQKLEFSILGPAGSLEYTIYWGDNSSSTLQSSGEETQKISHIWKEPGQYSIKVFVHTKEDKWLQTPRFNIQIKNKTLAKILCNSPDIEKGIMASYYFPRTDQYINLNLTPILSTISGRIEHVIYKNEVIGIWQGEISLPPGRYRFVLHPGPDGNLYINGQLLEPVNSQSILSIDKIFVVNVANGTVKIAVEWSEVTDKLRLSWIRLNDNPQPSKIKIDLYLVKQGRTCIVGQDGNDLYVYNRDGSKFASFAIDKENGLPKALKPSDPDVKLYPKKVCLTLTLTDKEIVEIEKEFNQFTTNIQQWSSGSIQPEGKIIILNGEITMSRQGDGWLIRPSDIESLATNYLRRDTDFAILTNSIGDSSLGLYVNPSYCGLSFLSEQTKGALSAWVPKTYSWTGYECATSESYSHEFSHLLGFSLVHLMGLKSVYPISNRLPMCGQADKNSYLWFPNPDKMELDPDAPWCGTKVPNGDAATKHLLQYHYDPTMKYYAFDQLYGNHCRNNVQDFMETDIDKGGGCPDIEEAPLVNN